MTLQLWDRLKDLLLGKAHRWWVWGPKEPWTLFLPEGARSVVLQRVLCHSERRWRWTYQQTSRFEVIAVVGWDAAMIHFGSYDAPTPEEALDHFASEVLARRQQSHGHTERP